MEPIAYWLPLVWAALLGIGVIMYVLLDGFDLGIGILFLTGADEQERDTMMNLIAPYWDGNETWLVLGGAGLLVAFPMAYGIIMPALYLPVMIMLLALVFRGVAFEFRFVAKPRHRWWDWSFALGSTVATFCQGLVLGGFVQGISVKDGQFAGRKLRMAGAVPYPLRIRAHRRLRAPWLVLAHDEDRGRGRTEGAIPRRGGAYRHAVFHRGRQPVDPSRFRAHRDRWFHGGRLAYLWPVPFLTAAVAFVAWVGIRKPSGVQAFLSAMVLFLSASSGLASRPFPISCPRA